MAIELQDQSYSMTRDGVMQYSANLVMTDANAAVIATYPINGAFRADSPGSYAAMKTELKNKKTAVQARFNALATALASESGASTVADLLADVSAHILS